MPKVKFDYDIKKDAGNWVARVKDKDFWELDRDNELAPIPLVLRRKMEKSSGKKLLLPLLMLFLQILLKHL